MFGHGSRAEPRQLRDQLSPTAGRLRARVTDIGLPSKRGGLPTPGRAASIIMIVIGPRASRRRRAPPTMPATATVEIISSIETRSARLRPPNSLGAVAQARVASVRGIAGPMSADADVSLSGSAHQPSCPRLIGITRLGMLADARLRIKRVGT